MSSHTTVDTDVTPTVDDNTAVSVAPIARGLIIDWAGHNPDTWTITPRPEPPAPRRSPWPRRAALTAACTVAAASTALSFTATAALAAHTGAAPVGLAWLVPIAIDGTLVAAAANLAAWSANGRPGRRPRLPTITAPIFLAASAFLNAAHAAPNWLARGIAAVAPISLIIATELAVNAHHTRS